MENMGADRPGARATMPPPQGPFRAAGEHRSDRPAGPAPRRVLVADDHLVTRRVLEMLLARWGLQPFLVTGGRDAIAAVDEANARGQAFSLVVLDSDMPDVDGLAVAAELVRRGSHSRDKIVMLTSNVQPAHIAEMARTGLGAALAKPVVPAELRAAVERCLAADPGHPDGVAHPDAGSPARRCRVLIAEDSRVNQMVVARLLERIGHTVVVASDGREAVEAFQREPFDLVLMDVQMPEMDGVQATLAIRALEAGLATRAAIVAMTARADAEDRRTCLAAGMDDVLMKPVRATEFYVAIRRIVEGPRERAAPVPPG
jgi:CheY-like chemotaxis protein